MFQTQEEDSSKNNIYSSYMDEEMNGSSKLTRTDTEYSLNDTMKNADEFDDFDEANKEHSNQATSQNGAETYDIDESSTNNLNDEDTNNREKTEENLVNDDEDEDEDSDDENINVLIDLKSNPQATLNRQKSVTSTKPANGAAPGTASLPTIQPAANNLTGATVPNAINSLKVPQQQAAQPVKGVDVEAPGTINGVPTYEYDLADVNDEDKPWRKPGADITDYFNYGFSEESWILYCMKQKRLRAENSSFKVR